MRPTLLDESDCLRGIQRAKPLVKQIKLSDSAGFGLQHSGGTTGVAVWDFELRDSTDRAPAVVSGTSGPVRPLPPNPTN